ncbi:putative HicB family RNase H-like nuclease [Leucobacter exalbidus]|uniref:HicB family RNase H-like nuclease n=1 Tax=Leucobacter exalbidus TaxID=662960 RepID=A0A940T2Q9_9MICO|nr:toxin-antitoxin system HicB family antitoxin [Leucobacter exalbidus]MBP1324854.1 putative HicB family RNase H-like nuclease [Leucobacter exalbidus]
MSSNHYTYRVTWSAEDEEFVGTVAELPSLSFLDEVSAQAFVGIQALAAEVVQQMLDEGETPPQALADRTYSGNFMIRVTPETHRKLVIEAAEQHVSLNRLSASRLVGT